jgi:glucuronokinase
MAPASGPRPHGRAFARTALAGNPSDGYGGAVLAVTIPALEAHASIGASRQQASCQIPLVEAAARRFTRETGLPADPATIGWATRIPLTVGLGGSSAIVIAVLRALCAQHGTTIPPEDLATLALAVETEELGIAAGLQDRVAQSFGGLTCMDFGGSEPAYERLDPALLPPLAIAWREDTGEASGVTHGDLRGRFDRGEKDVHSAMRALGDAARAARDALKHRDHGEFAAAVDASFDLRASILQLDPRHVEMIGVARATGAAANYTGSGGAIVVVCRNGEHRDLALKRIAGIGAATLALDISN